MAFCNNQYPDLGSNVPNAAVGFASGTVTIDTEGTPITYPTIVVTGSGGTQLATPLEWFGANLIGANIFGLNFAPSATLWTSQTLAAGPAFNISDSESKTIENASSTFNLCRAGYLYKPACISKINEWLDSPEAIRQIGRGWRVATQEDFRNLQTAIGGQDTVFKIRTTAPLSTLATSNTTQWSDNSTATPAGVTLNYSGFNAFAPGCRQVTGGLGQQARLAAWWIGPSNGDPNGTDNKFGTGNINTMSVSAWYDNVGTAVNGTSQLLRFNISSVLLLNASTLSNDPRSGNSIRLVRDYVNPSCNDLTTLDSLNRTITYDSAVIEGTTYPTLWIGAQKWVAANFIGTLGGAIQYVETQTSWNSLTAAAYSYYNAPADLLECVNGYLYNGYASTAINARLVSTASLYRVPSTDDYTELLTTLGLTTANGGGTLKTTSPTATSYWTAPNTGATNNSGFSGVGAGIRGISGSVPNYSLLDLSTSFWTRTAGLTAGNLQHRSLSNTSVAFDLLQDSDQKFGRSVRLLIPSIPINVVFAGAGSGTVQILGSDSSITNTSSTGYTIRLRNGENAIITATPNPNSEVTSVTAVVTGVGTPITIAGGQIASLSVEATVTVTFGIYVPPSVPNEWDKENLCVGDTAVLLNYNCDIVNTVSYIVMDGVSINTFNINPSGDPCTISFVIPSGVSIGQTVSVNFYGGGALLLDSLPFLVRICGGNFFGPDSSVGAPACSNITYTNSDCSIIQNFDQLYVDGVEAAYAIISNAPPCQILIEIPELQGNFPKVVKIDFYADGRLTYTESYPITANCDGEGDGEILNPSCLQLLETDNLTFVDCETGQVVPFEEGTIFKRTGWTISFSTELGVWESRHTYLPYMYMYNTKAMYTLYREFEVDSFWKHTERVKRLLYYGRPVQDNFELDIIFPGEDRRTTTGSSTTKNSNKIFSAFAISADSFEDGLDMMRNKYNLPFTEFYVYNSFQISGLVDMNYLSNVRRVDGSWVINEFRDLSRYGSVSDGLATLSPGVGEQMFLEEGEINFNYISSTKEWYDKRKFVDKWVGLRLIYNPSITNSNVDLVYLYNVVFNSRQSFR